MKKAIWLVVLFFITVATQVFSQPMNRTGLYSPGVQHLITQYGDELQLTDDQKSQLIALQIEHRNQFRADRRPGNRGDRGNFRRDRNNNNWRGNRGQGFRNPGNRGISPDARIEMRKEVLNIITNEQLELLQTKMIEQAERAHEFRTFRYEYIVNEAGIEGDKVDQVLALLNGQSEARLELARQRILNPEEINQDLFARQFQKMRDTDDELRNLLTVDEYESLYKNLGFGNRPYRNSGRRYRMWSR